MCLAKNKIPNMSQFNRLFFKLSTVSVLSLSAGAAAFTPLYAHTGVHRPADIKVDEIGIESAKKINATTIKLSLTNGEVMLLDFYGDNIFRFFQDNSGKGFRAPQAKPEAQILVDQPREALKELKLIKTHNQITIQTGAVKVVFDKSNTLFKIINTTTGKVVVEEVAPVSFGKEETHVELKAGEKEYFYGGGVQNGRFSHKGKSIKIENQNSWTDGGVASPTPFYWSTKGYGVMWYTFKKGVYDFGATEKGKVKLTHESPYLDLFFMIAPNPVALLQSFYQLTGNPVLLPKFGFYEGHLNAYNRDYWKEDEKGILFEDGKRYKESQKDNGGTKESLNGEKNNYQFSARAVVDRYADNDMPLGWILPNDGYGAGYGQGETLDENIANLKRFGDYARKHGVEIGLWTQSDLHPKPGVSALLQRDIVKEVRDAGVRVLKTDVAWVGAGYSFGLNGVADVAQIMPKYGNNARPFIITLDGWAGTQRYATVWTGDQTGGKWEYIRFHIPTYIGSGLSGQPNITSDMDGIFGGKNPIVNARDFQWKTFTPMELNMDGWGANPKYPTALGEPTTSINRNYLKLKSQLLPYEYSIAHEAVTGKPMIRAMFLEEKNPYTLGTRTQYQYLYGPYFLVAPIYQDTHSDKAGNDIRNNIYLPKGKWVDYFTGQQYEGDRIINNFDSPIWKLPLLVKRGAIIPMVNPNNNVSEIKKDLRIYQIYPYGTSTFYQYNDDGVSQAYKTGAYATTKITSQVEKDRAEITVYPTQGHFDNFVTAKTTLFRINVTEKPKSVKAYVNGKKVKLQEAASLEEFKQGENVYFYAEAPNFNRFSTSGSSFEQVKIIRNPQVRVKVASTDITQNTVSVKLRGFEFNPENPLLQKTGDLTPPQQFTVKKEDATPYTLKPSWEAVPNADFYEIEFEGMLYSTIKNNHLLFEDLTPETTYDFKLRAVNQSGVSDWVPMQIKTADDPYQFAIKGISGEVSAPAQGGYGIADLFDGDQGSMWHTKWGKEATPFDMIIDLHSVNQLDKLQYLPRTDAGNGTILHGSVFYSNDKQHWTKAGEFSWERDGKTKVFEFKDKPTAGYVKISVDKAVGKYGSGSELYVFKVPGSVSYLPGDINNDRLIDMNDITSYMNYMGLRLGDADFEGYVSQGDVNKNNRIDAYDISVVATKIGEDAKRDSSAMLAGVLKLSTPKTSYKKGEIVEVTVKAFNFSAVNAFSFALPYSEQDYEFVGIEKLHLNKMRDFTKDRLHSDGEKVLYPTFVNMGNQKTLNLTGNLFIIKLKAKQDLKFNLKIQQGLLVSKDLKTKALQ